MSLLDAIISYNRTAEQKSRSAGSPLQSPQPPTPVAEVTEVTEPRVDLSHFDLHEQPGENQHADSQPESLDVQVRFNRVHAKLFPFLGCKVRTPKGPGTLLQVFAARVTVLLDTDINKCSFFSPAEVQPVTRELNS